MSVEVRGDRPDVVVVGVPGCGRSTVVAPLAAHLGWSLVEADAFHSPADVALAAGGAALTDDGARVRFVHLDGARDTIAARLARREGHFRPAALPGSPLETLEPWGPDEDGVVVDVDGSPDVLAQRALAALDLSPRTTGSEPSCLR